MDVFYFLLLHFHITYLFCFLFCLCVDAVLPHFEIICWSKPLIGLHWNGCYQWLTALILKALIIWDSRNTHFVLFSLQLLVCAFWFSPKQQLFKLGPSCFRKLRGDRHSPDFGLYFTISHTNATTLQEEYKVEVVQLLGYRTILSC